MGESASGGRVNRTCTTAPVRALWYEAPGHASLRLMELDALGDDLSVVRAEWSLISRGTERLVFHGLVAPSEWQRMRAPMQEGAFPFPVKYGYAVVGLVEDGPAPWIGRRVFALHPHQERFVAPVSALLPVPDAIPPRRASLAANMETALNALWDAGASPGDRVVVVGAGVVGLLVAYLCARLPGAEVTVIDRLVGRRDVAEALGARFALPEAAPEGADIVVHASATAKGLETALAACGREATLVELSWYGSARVEVPLGEAFHAERLKLVSSQVGEVAPSHRPRWSHHRRLAKAMELLACPALDALLTTELAFDALPEALPEIFAPGWPGLTASVRYGGSAG